MTATGTLIEVPSLSRSPSAALLADPIWHRSAPREIREAYRPQLGGKTFRSWIAWRNRLAQRSRTMALSRLLRSRTNPLAWAMPEEASCGTTPFVLAQLTRLLSGPDAAARSVEPLLLAWLRVADRPASAGYALESLAWCHALPRLAAVVSPNAWWDLLERLLRTAGEASALNHRQSPLLHQLLAGELPLALASLLPEINACHKLLPGARRRLSHGLVDLLDGEGLLHARRWDVQRPLLACWTRAAALGSCLPKGCWSEAAQGQFEWLVLQSLRTTRADGSQVLSSGLAGERCDELFAAALRLAGDQTAGRVAALVLPPGKKTEPRTRPDFPPPAEHSQWARAVVLRSQWIPSSPRLTVLFPDQTMRIELESAGEVLWSGQWETRLHCDGELVEPRSAWSDVCWISNDEADYFEAELRLTGQLRIQRHIMLARRDRFLFVADAVLGRRHARLEYQSCLPLTEGTTFRPAEETREGTLLRGGRSRALVLPPALPEWQADQHVGSLTAADGRLELRQTAQGRSLLAPLWIDLEPQRLARQCTWRQLTVGEKLTAVPHDVAVGFRVMVGLRQWLIYRSLSRPGNRTVLGHNLITETLLARFNDGDVEPLVEIE